MHEFPKQCVKSINWICVMNPLPFCKGAHAQAMEETWVHAYCKNKHKLQNKYLSILKTVIAFAK